MAVPVRARPAEATSVKLSDFDWSFASAVPSRLDNLHPYPARFIQQIPAQLIDLFPPAPGTTVLDPFCGAGATLVAAAEHALPAIGIDLNPIAVLISRVKTTPLRAPVVPTATQVVAEARRTRAPIPPLPRLDHWFEPAVQDALARLTAAIDRRNGTPESDALRVALSRIIVRVSNQESDTRYAAVHKNVSGEDVFRLFLDAALTVETAVQERYGGLLGREPQCRVHEADVLTLTAADIDADVGLVVTSPPYPNAYEYWLYHKYRMYWLGYDPLPVRNAEIGARPHYFKKNHQTEVDFERQMARCFTLLAELMRRGAHACFVVGNSIIHGRLIDNAALIERVATSSGFASVDRIARPVAQGRKSFNLAHARLKEETILVFCRQ